MGVKTGENGEGMGAFEKCKSELDIDQPSCLLSSLTSYVPTLWVILSKYKILGVDILGIDILGS